MVYALVSKTNNSSSKGSNPFNFIKFLFISIILYYRDEWNFDLSDKESLNDRVIQRLELPFHTREVSRSNRVTILDHFMKNTIHL